MIAVLNSFQIPKGSTQPIGKDKVTIFLTFNKIVRSVNTFKHICLCMHSQYATLTENKEQGVLLIPYLINLNINICGINFVYIQEYKVIINFEKDVGKCFYIKISIF